MDSIQYDKYLSIQYVRMRVVDFCIQEYIVLDFRILSVQFGEEGNKICSANIYNNMTI